MEDKVKDGKNVESAPEFYSYFIIKCISLESFQKCVESEFWAFRKRVSLTQPQDLLEKAHAAGRVILIFSIKNQHGWHGYCESLYPQKSEECEDSSNLSLKHGGSDADEWTPFSVKWITNFISISPQSCLHLDMTKGLFCLDNTPVNQARNWQQVNEETGTVMCGLIDQQFKYDFEHMQALEKARLEALRAEEEFLEKARGCDTSNWEPIIEKVEKTLGKVILACPFGSQRYNVSLPDSDTDILIIYQATTMAMLGLDTPQQTIKNNHSSEVDYTVLELKRYCELLVAGDTKYVETLFLEDDCVIPFASDSWKQLQGVRDLLLTSECLEKYLREVKGTKGLKQFDKWRGELRHGETAPPKLNKLGYILLRILQSARDIVKCGWIQVYRKDGSEAQLELLNARTGILDPGEMSDLFKSYLQEIGELRKGASFADPKKVKPAVEKWLVEARLQDFQSVGVADDDDPDPS